MKNSPLKPVPKYGGFSPDPAALNAGENMTHDLNDYPTPYWERYIADLKEKERRMETVNKFLKEIGYEEEE